MKRMIVVVVMMMACLARGALQQVNTWTIDPATFIPNANWNQKGDILAARITANGLSLFIQRAGTVTPVEYPVPDGVGLTYVAVYASDDLKYVVVDARNGDLHYCYCYKIGSLLKRVATYSWNGALSGGAILQGWYGSRFVVAQQTDAAGNVSVTVYSKGFKSQSAHTCSTHAGASENPAVRVSPHGRYIALERTYDGATGVRHMDIMSLTSDFVLDKDMASWPVWHGPDDNVVIYGLQAGGVSWIEVDQLEPWALLLQYQQADAYETAWISTKKTPLAAVMYRSNQLLVRNDTTVVGPHAISGIPAGAGVTCPYFDGKIIVLCIVQLPAGPYELRSYAVTPAGFVQKSGPVAGAVLPITSCDQSYVRLYEATAAGATFRLYSKSLKSLGALSVPLGIPSARGRTCMILQPGVGTLTLTIVRW